MKITGDFERMFYLGVSLIKQKRNERSEKIESKRRNMFKIKGESIIKR